MENADTTIDTDLGERIKALRTRLKLTIEDLAVRSGVSRAMISKIERGESSATAQLLGRLCAALGVTLSALFARQAPNASPLSRRGEQRVWQDPGSGYVRRAVSPALADGVVELVEVVLPPGAIVPFERQHLTGVDQLIWILEGALDMSIGNETHALNTGDCLHMRFEEPMTFRNTSAAAVRYAVVLAHGRSSAR
jgi:transcriptional regulator with XRE-family HTH domain